jgi:hypothetical protein
LVGRSFLIPDFPFERRPVLASESQSKTSSEGSVSPLIGSWRIVSFELRDEQRVVSHPWGHDVIGINTYAADGYMSEQFARADRPELAHDDWVEATPAEIDGAARGYFAYAGPYQIDGQEVVYQIDVSLMPNWIGKTERRFWSISDDTLTITTPPLVVGGKTQVSTLVYERVQNK